MDETDSSELLINPCNCKGTSGFVHMGCIQQWINSKSKKKNNNIGVTCTYWNKLNCEVCSVSLPDYVRYDNQRYEIAPIERPDSPYLILERVFYDKSKVSVANTKMMILVNLENPTFQIKLVKYK